MRVALAVARVGRHSEAACSDGLSITSVRQAARAAADKQWLPSLTRPGDRPPVQRSGNRPSKCGAAAGARGVASDGDPSSVLVHPFRRFPRFAQGLTAALKPVHHAPAVSPVRAFSIAPRPARRCRGRRGSSRATLTTLFHSYRSPRNSLPQASAAAARIRFASMRVA